MKVSKNNKMTVYKSHPLVSLTEVGLTIRQLKIVDCYLAKIHPTNPESANVQIRLSELKKCLGIENYTVGDLAKDLFVLENESVPIVYKNKTTYLKLFKIAGYVYDEFGYILIELECSDEAMKYMFNTQKIGYIDYPIEHISRIFSIKAYRLFLKMRQNRFRKAWVWSINVFAKILGCKPTVKDMRTCHERVRQYLLKSGITFTCVISKKYDMVKISNFSLIKLSKRESKGKTSKRQIQKKQERKAINQFTKSIRYFVKNGTIVNLSAHEREFLDSMIKTNTPPSTLLTREDEDNDRYDGFDPEREYRKWIRENNDQCDESNREWNNEKHFARKKRLGAFEYKKWNLDDVKKLINRFSDDDEDITLEDIRNNT